MICNWKFKMAIVGRAQALCKIVSLSMLGLGDVEEPHNEH